MNQPCGPAKSAERVARSDAGTAGHHRDQTFKLPDPFLVLATTQNRLNRKAHIRCPRRRLIVSMLKLVDRLSKQTGRARNHGPHGGDGQTTSSRRRLLRRGARFYGAQGWSIPSIWTRRSRITSSISSSRRAIPRPTTSMSPASSNMGLTARHDLPGYRFKSVTPSFRAAVT